VQEIINYIINNNIGKHVENDSLSNYTTYKVGGPAKLIVYPKNREKLVLLLKELKNKKIKYMILGNGSNTLFSDKEYDGVIIKLDCLDKVTYYRNLVKAEAGVNLIKLSYQTIKRGLAGLEFASGIPGTVGGAIFMNAGAYKSDMGYVTKSIEVLTPKLEIITMTNKELDFHYRTSFLQKHRGYICLEATFQLRKNDKDLLQEIVDDRKRRRLESQPLEYPSAGSVFRNPENDFAGRLIEELGYKGYSIGGAKVSEKHANFIINSNNAKAEDVKKIIELLQKEVKEKYNIDLKCEQEFVNWE
jgi:UDP-N-acetylmuramate dehydrogenase